MVTGIFTIPIHNVAHCSDPGVPPYVVGTENSLVGVLVQELITRQANHSQLSHLAVVHGPSGIGKSHLLRALAVTWQAGHSSQAIGHWNAVDWAREHAQAIRNEAVDAFHKQLDSLDILVLDDLDQLIKYQSAQRALCSWLDRCQWHNKTVLIGCTQHPNSVNTWIAALASRLQAGLLLRVAAPELATREAIVSSLAMRRRFPLTPAAAKLISQRVSGSPRDLQTAVLRCQATAATFQSTSHSRGQTPSRALDELSTPEPFDEAQVAAVLGSFEGVDEPISLRVITRIVARYFDLTQRLLTGRSRRRGVTQARGMAIYLCRELTKESFNRIGRHFDGRDHSTIVHSYEKTKTAIDEDPQIQQIYREIVYRLGQVRP